MNSKRAVIAAFGAAWFGVVASGTALAAVRVNEVMPSNDQTIQTANGGKGLDWIELYNDSDEAVDLTGWKMNDSPTKPSKAVLIEGDPMIAAHGYKIVWADKDYTGFAAHESYVRLGLSDSGESAALVNPEGVIVSQVDFPGLMDDVSYGVDPATGACAYFREATPGTGNAAEPCGPVTPAVQFSVAHGYKTEAFDLTLSCADAPDAEIRYTLDGTSPNAASPVYSEPLHIERTTIIRAAVLGNNPVLQTDTSATYVFLDDVLAQAPTAPRGTGAVPENFPANYEVPTHITTKTSRQTMHYGMIQATVNANREQIERGFSQIPTISVVANPADLFNTSNGLYVTGKGSKLATTTTTYVEEVPMLIELFDRAGREAGFSAPCGLRIRGATSRDLNHPKHSLRFCFRGGYGMNKLNYPMFPDDPTAATKFKKIDLRCSQNFSWANEDSAWDTFVTEVFQRDIQGDMGEYHTRSRYYHLFLNGQYWGLYQTEERADEDFAETYNDNNKDNSDFVKTSYINWKGFFTDVAEGTTNAWNALFTATKEGFAGEHAANFQRLIGLNADGTRNSEYPIYLNVTNLVTYIMIGHFVSDCDCPQSLWGGFANNIYAHRDRVDGESKQDGFFWLRHDGEQSLGVSGKGYEADDWAQVTNDPTGYGTSEANPYPTMPGEKTHFYEFRRFGPTELNWQLLKNPDYRRIYGDLFYKHCLRPDGALYVTNARVRYEGRMAEIDDAVMCEAARWSRGTNVVTDASSITNKLAMRSYATWQFACSNALDFIDRRMTYLKPYYQARGWYPSFDPPIPDAWGGATVPGATVTFTGGVEGVSLYVTTDGSDPMYAETPASPTVTLASLPMTVKARTKSGEEWSALQEMRFVSTGASDRFTFKGAYDAPQTVLPLGDKCTIVLDGATLPALTLPGNVKYTLVPTGVSTLGSLTGDEAQVSVKGAEDSTLCLKGADTLCTVSNLTVKAGTFQVVSTGVSADKIPVVKLLGYVKQTGGTIDLQLAPAGCSKRIYGIYLASKNVADAAGEDTVYAEFKDGTLQAIVGGVESAALACTKGSVDISFEDTTVVEAVLAGPKTRFVDFDGKIKIKAGELSVAMPEDVTGLADVRAFKCKKDLTVSGGHVSLNLPGAGAEGLAADEKITISGGTLELVTDDDCVNATVNILVSGGLIYAESLSNDCFDSNGSMEISGGTILAYATSDNGGHAAFDVEPEKTEDKASEHVLTILSGTIFATGGAGSRWPSNLVTGPGVVLDARFGQAVADWSQKYVSLSNAVGTLVTTARLPALTGADCSVLFTAPERATGAVPAVSDTAPASGDQDFHGLYVEKIAAVAVTVSPTAYKATGAAIIPTRVAVQVDGVTLTPGKDYTLSYDNNVAVGKQARVTATFVGRYAHVPPATQTFEIVSEFVYTEASLNLGPDGTFTVDRYVSDGGALRYIDKVAGTNKLLTIIKPATFRTTGRADMEFYVGDERIGAFDSLGQNHVYGPITNAWVCYVSTGGDNENTGADLEHAFETVQYAIDNVGPNGTVMIAAGTYETAITVVLTNNVSLVGCAEQNTGTILSLKATSDKTKNVLKMLSSSGSVVTNLTLTNNSGSHGSGVEMDGGMLTHCVVRDCRTDNNTDYGGGVNMTAGTVRHCLITNCVAKDSGGAGRHGGGVYMTGGLVENCRIVGNGNVSASEVGTGSGGGVYMTGGTLRGCLIAGNKKPGAGTGVYVKGGTVENCTIVGNTQSTPSSTSSAVWIEGAASVFRNNILWGNTAHDGVTPKNWSYKSDVTAANVYNNDSPTAIALGSNNICANPNFVDFAGGDYRIGFSGCVDAGTNGTWMATVTDLNGTPRIVSGTVDMGCYEYVPSVLACAFSQRVVESGLDRVRITFEAQVSGADSADTLTYTWTFTRADGFSESVSGTEYAIYTRDFATGTWDVRLDVGNGAGATAAMNTPTAFKVGASVVYANKTGSGTYPCTTPETATNDVDMAFRLLGDGGTLYVGAGDYVITQPLRLNGDHGSRIIGSGPAQTSIRLGNVPLFTQTGGYRGLSLLQASAYVEGIALVGGCPGAHYEGTEYGIWNGVSEMSVAGAVITNCVFRDAKAARTGIYGLGLNMSAGQVVDCRYENLSSSSGAYAAALYMKGGTADRIVISDCYTGESGAVGSSVNGDIVKLDSGGTMKNSLITRCRPKRSVTVGVKGAKALLANCTVVCNTNEASSVKNNILAAGVGAYEGGQVKNCIIVDNWSTYKKGLTNLVGAATYTLVNDRDESFVTAENHNRVGDAGFVNAAAGDFHLAQSSAINAGDWTALGGTAAAVEAQCDLDGNVRLSGEQVDLGCYEALTPIAKPTAAMGLVRDGTTQVGVAAGEHYDLSGDVCEATEIGTYTVYATPKRGYMWDDGSTEPLMLTWTIAPKDVAELDWSVDYANFWYTGKARNPTDSATWGGASLVLNTDFTVTNWNKAASYKWNEPVKAVDTIITNLVYGKGNYAGVCAVATFKNTRQRLYWNETCGTSGSGAWNSEDWQLYDLPDMGNDDERLRTPNNIVAVYFNTAEGQTAAIDLEGASNTRYNSITVSGKGITKVHNGTFALEGDINVGTAGANLAFENVTFTNVWSTTKGDVTRKVFNNGGQSRVIYSGNNLFRAYKDTLSKKEYNRYTRMGFGNGNNVTNLIVNGSTETEADMFFNANGSGTYYKHLVISNATLKTLTIKPDTHQRMKYEFWPASENNLPGEAQKPMLEATTMTLQSGDTAKVYAQGLGVGVYNILICSTGTDLSVAASPFTAEKLVANTTWSAGVLPSYETVTNADETIQTVRLRLTAVTLTDYPVRTYAYAAHTGSAVANPMSLMSSDGIVYTVTDAEGNQYALDNLTAVGAYMIKAEPASGYSWSDGSLPEPRYYPFAIIDMGRYQKIPFVRSNYGYIDTGIAIQRNIKADLSFFTTAPKANPSYLLAAYGGSNQKLEYLLATRNNGYNIYAQVGDGTVRVFGDKSGSGSGVSNRVVVAINAGTALTLVQEKGENAYTNQHTVGSLTANDKTLYLFARNNNGTMDYASADFGLYGATIYTNGNVTAREYVPFFDKQSKAFGLYDIVTGNFKTSDRAGYSFHGPGNDFTWIGPEGAPTETGDWNDPDNWYYHGVGRGYSFPNSNLDNTYFTNGMAKVTVPTDSGYTVGRYIDNADTDVTLYGDGKKTITYSNPYTVHGRLNVVGTSVGTGAARFLQSGNATPDTFPTLYGTLRLENLIHLPFSAAITIAGEGATVQFVDANVVQDQKYGLYKAIYNPDNVPLELAITNSNWFANYAETNVLGDATHWAVNCSTAMVGVAANACGRDIDLVDSFVALHNVNDQIYGDTVVSRSLAVAGNSKLALSGYYAPTGMVTFIPPAGGFQRSEKDIYYYWSVVAPGYVTFDMRVAYSGVAPLAAEKGADFSRSELVVDASQMTVADGAKGPYPLVRVDPTNGTLTPPAASDMTVTGAPAGYVGIVKATADGKGLDLVFESADFSKVTWTAANNYTNFWYTGKAGTYPTLIGTTPGGYRLVEGRDYTLKLSKGSKNNETTATLAEGSYTCLVTGKTPFASESATTNVVPFKVVRQTYTWTNDSGLDAVGTWTGGAWVTNTLVDVGNAADRYTYPTGVAIAYLKPDEGTVASITLGGTEAQPCEASAVLISNANNRTAWLRDGFLKLGKSSGVHDWSHPGMMAFSNVTLMADSRVELNLCAYDTYLVFAGTNTLSSNIYPTFSASRSNKQLHFVNGTTAIGNGIAFRTADYNAIHINNAAVSMKTIDPRKNSSGSSIRVGDLSFNFTLGALNQPNASVTDFTPMLAVTDTFSFGNEGNGTPSRRATIDAKAKTTAGETFDILTLPESFNLYAPFNGTTPFAPATLAANTKCAAGLLPEITAVTNGNLQTIRLTVKRDISKLTAAVKNPEKIEYTGSDLTSKIKFTVTGTFGGESVTLAEGTDYDIALTEEGKIGREDTSVEYTATITGKGDYAGTLTAKYMILGRVFVWVGGGGDNEWNNPRNWDRTGSGTNHGWPGDDNTSNSRVFLDIVKFPAGTASINFTLNGYYWNLAGVKRFEFDPGAILTVTQNGASQIGPKTDATVNCVLHEVRGSGGVGPLSLGGDVPYPRYPLLEKELYLENMSQPPWGTAIWFAGTTGPTLSATGCTIGQGTWREPEFITFYCEDDTLPVKIAMTNTVWRTTCGSKDANVVGRNATWTYCNATNLTGIIANHFGGKLTLDNSVVGFQNLHGTVAAAAGHLPGGATTEGDTFYATGLAFSGANTKFALSANAHVSGNLIFTMPAGGFTNSVETLNYQEKDKVEFRIDTSFANVAPLAVVSNLDLTAVTKLTVDATAIAEPGTYPLVAAGSLTGVAGLDIAVTTRQGLSGGVQHEGNKLNLVIWQTCEVAALIVQSGNEIKTNRFTTLEDAFAGAVDGANVTNVVMLLTNVVTKSVSVTKDVTFQGDVWEVALPKFTVSSGKTLTIAGGYIGVDAIDGEGQYHIMGGKYVTNTTFTVASDYHYAKLASIVQLYYTYSYQVIAGAAQDVPSDEVVLPALKGDDDDYVGEIRYTLKDLEEKGIKGTMEAIVTNLNTISANKNRHWENLVLGLSHTDTNAVPVLSALQTSNPNKLTLKLDGLDIDDKAGATVRCRVMYTDKEKKVWETDGKYYTPAQIAEQNLPTSGVRYYRVEIEVIPAK